MLSNSPRRAAINVKQFVRGVLFCDSMGINRLAVSVVATGIVFGATPDVRTIIQKSVEANARDFRASPHFNHKERDQTATGTKTTQVDMIDGSPYSRVLAVNGESLTREQEAQEQNKEQQERKRRDAESAGDRQARIAKWEKGRRRDNSMMDQLTGAFNFNLLGTKTVRGFDVYVLKATPKPGYQPPNISAQVLPGMRGEMWIDQKTFQWVKVTAQVIEPVSIEGFLAQVEPGTRFEVEKSPVGDGSVWLVSHFSMQATAKVLFMFSHNSQDDVTFWDYQPTK